MANLNDLKRQHKEIGEILEYLKSNLEENKVREEAAKLSQNINILAGKLKIHLITEDDSLYPKLLNGTDLKTKETAERFFKEMGNLAQVFTDYKLKYNIGSRIISNIDGYIIDTAAVIEALQKRIGKEDKELYILL